MAVPVAPRLYLDTNIYLDHFLHRPGRSTDLFNEISRGTFDGITAYFTISELAGVMKNIPTLNRNRIPLLIDQAKKFPNITIAYHDPTSLHNMHQEILNTCCQCRDVLHYMMAKHLNADYIITRDRRFIRAINAYMPAQEPEVILTAHRL